MAPRILYIEDDEGLAHLVRRALGRAGYEVEVAPCGQSGVAAAGMQRFDVIALDHYLPGETGLDVLPRLRALPNPAPVVYVTGSEDSRVAVAALKGGAVDYVWKDVQGHFQELLTEAISSAIENDRLRRAKEAADEQVRAARDRAEILLKEVNHRVANSLAIVSSLAQMEAARTKEPAVRNAMEVMGARIQAIAGVHRSLYTSDQVGLVELNTYLGDLIRELQLGAQGAIKISFTGDRLAVTTDRAVSIGVVVTELVTNALKYAYPDGAGGPIRVTLRRDAERACLGVEDDGAGWQGDGPLQGSGLGMRIVKVIAANLKSELLFDGSHRGTRVTISFPI